MLQQDTETAQERIAARFAADRCFRQHARTGQRPGIKEEGTRGRTTFLNPYKIAASFVEAIVIFWMAKAVLSLPIWGRTTMEGGRKILLFFNLD